MRNTPAWSPKFLLVASEYHELAAIRNDRQDRVHELQAFIDAIQAGLLAAVTSGDELRAERDRMVASGSWRRTRPLCRLGGRVRRSIRRPRR